MRKFFLKTYGCKLNQADSRLMREFLKKDYQEASLTEAQIIIINSCGVIERTERKILKEIKKLKKEKKKILLAGCLPLISKKVIPMVDGVIGPSNILFLKSAIEEIFQGKKPIYLQRRKIDKAKLCRFLEKPQDSCVMVIPISEGCLGKCSYCAVRMARGKLKSFSMREIIREIKLALDLGYKEIHLTSQDIASFGLDRGEYQLPKLIDKIVNLPYQFRVRIGMGNPQHFKKILPSLIKIYQSEKIYKYLHLPVQSGSDRVLKEMKRGYRVKDFLEVVEKMKEKFNNLMLVVDVIVGYPTETSKDFQKTVSLVKRISPRIVNITKFSKREKTEASLLKDLPQRVKKERSRFLSQIALEIRKKDSQKFLGKEEKVLVVQKIKENIFLARPSHFRAVILKNEKIGEFLEVKITGLKRTFLLGKRATKISN